MSQSKHYFAQLQVKPTIKGWAQLSQFEVLCNCLQTFTQRESKKWQDAFQMSRWCICHLLHSQSHLLIHESHLTFKTCWLHSRENKPDLSAAWLLTASGQNNVTDAFAPLSLQLTCIDFYKRAHKAALTPLCPGACIVPPAVTTDDVVYLIYGHLSVVSTHILVHFLSDLLFKVAAQHVGK